MRVDVHADRQFRPALLAQRFDKTWQQVAQLGGNRRVGGQQRPTFVIDRSRPYKRLHALWQVHANGRVTCVRLRQPPRQIGQTGVLIQSTGQWHPQRHG